MPLAQANWLPPVLAAPGVIVPDGDGDEAGEEAQVALAAAPSLPPSAAPPLDWTLKQSLRFTSGQPFTVWQEARTEPRTDGGWWCSR